jgi:hypothetical protein
MLIMTAVLTCRDVELALVAKNRIAHINQIWIRL